MKNQHLIVSPLQVPYNAIVTIRSAENTFPDNGYMITDQNGRTVRKGAIAKGMTEFCLSVVGMATGVYNLTVGQVQEQFIHYLAATPQFKNSKTAESTSNKMSDGKLIEYITTKL